MRVGHGIDVHRFGTTGPIVLLGVVVDDVRGIDATSDGDVAAHALTDALLGAAALGDIGTIAPPDDPGFEGADSMQILGRAVALAREAGFVVTGVDVTIVAQTIRMAPHRSEMRRRAADVLGLPIDAVSVKATSTDGLGFVGRDEGIAVTAVAVLERQSA